MGKPSAVCCYPQSVMIPLVEGFNLHGHRAPRKISRILACFLVFLFFALSHTHTHTDAVFIDHPLCVLLWGLCLARHQPKSTAPDPGKILFVLPPTFRRCSNLCRCFPSNPQLVGPVHSEQQHGHIVNSLFKDKSKQARKKRTHRIKPAREISMIVRVFIRLFLQERLARFLTLSCSVP